jgi:hypothetical protein
MRMGFAVQLQAVVLVGSALVALVVAVPLREAPAYGFR